MLQVEEAVAADYHHPKRNKQRPPSKLFSLKGYRSNPLKINDKIYYFFYVIPTLKVITRKLCHCGTVVKRSAQCHEIEGLNPTTGTGKEKVAKSIVSVIFKN